MDSNYSFSQTRISDPLIEGPTNSQRAFPDRLFYATGVMLDKDDFLAEQLYHRGRLARVLSYLHGQGTVAGLRVRVDPAVRATRDQPAQDEQLVVEPGLAIDRFGRLIEVPRPCCIRLDRWFKAQADTDLNGAFKAPTAKTLISKNFDFKETTPTTIEAPVEVGGGLNGVVVDVFVRFVSCQRGYTSAFASGPFDATDATVPARLRDGFEFSLILRTESTSELQKRLPQPAWKNVTKPVEVQTQILDAWNEDTAWDASGELSPQPEHPIDKDNQHTDYTALFLARLLLPATKSSGTIQRQSDAEIRIDNYSRAFVYPVGAIARFLNPALT